MGVKAGSIVRGARVSVGRQRGKRASAWLPENSCAPSGLQDGHRKSPANSMNVPRPILRMFTLLLLLFVSRHHSAKAEDAVAIDESKLRGAIVRSLDFLSRETETWMNEKDCNACHHMPVLLWSEREAKRRGFAIDQAKLDEFTEWTDARAKKTNAGLEMLAFLKLAVPEKPTPELTKLIVDAQQPDGSWKPAGQFATMQRRETPEATSNSARLFLLALATQEPDAQITDAARAKAAALFEKDASAKSVETLVVRALYAQRFGNADEVNSLRAEVLKHQHSDGGWSFMLAEEKSDPLATGEVLFLLQQLPAAPPSDSVARGQGWLLKTQREDGGWPIDITRISRMDRSAPEKAKSFKAATDIYTYWGAAWATIGLLQGVPVSSR